MTAPRKPQPHEEVVARLDDAEFVALGVGEHHVPLRGALADVDMPCAEFECLRDRPLLVLQGLARQVEMHLVLAGLRFAGRQEIEPEAGVVFDSRAEEARPEPGETTRVVRGETERSQGDGHE